MFIIHCSSKYYCTLFNRRIYSILYFNFNFQDLFQLFPLFSPNCFHIAVRDNIGEYFRRPILNTYQTSPCIFLLKLIILRLPASAGGWYEAREQANCGQHSLSSSLLTVRLFSDLNQIPASLSTPVLRPCLTFIFSLCLPQPRIFRLPLEVECESHSRYLR